MKRTSIKTNKGVRTPICKCSKKKCLKKRSIRSTHRFFTFRDKNGRGRCNLTRRGIVLIIYPFLYSNDTIDQLQIKTGYGRNTIVDWLNLCREVCTHVIANQPIMIGTEDSPMQIDESYFSGRLKYNRGRFCAGDANGEEKEIRKTMSERELELIVKGRAHGPWVFRLHMKNNRYRFHVVENRPAATLMPLILKNVEKGSTIVWDLRGPTTGSVVTDTAIRR